MKKILLPLIVFIFIQGCDSPQRSRATTGVAAAGDTLGAPGTDLTPDPDTTPVTPTPTPTTDPNFPSCDLSYRYSNNDLGQVGLCQSSVDETMFKFKSSQTSSSRVCLIPTYKDAQGASTWLGQPQCTITNAGTTYNGRVYKTRTNYTNYPINGVMVMKEGLLVEYFQCMDAYINYVNTYCPLNPFNQVCVNNANAQRNQICNNFKAKYPSNYLDIRTK